MHQSCDIKDTLFMIRYCTCYVEYLFRMDVTDSRDSESLSSALLPVSLLDAQIHLYSLVNISDIQFTSSQQQGEKKSEDKCQGTAVITKEIPSQGKICSYFLSRNGGIHCNDL